MFSRMYETFGSTNLAHWNWIRRPRNPGAIFSAVKQFEGGAGFAKTASRLPGCAASFKLAPIFGSQQKLERKPIQNVALRFEGRAESHI
jgi:hypothetical protein